MLVFYPYRPMWVLALLMEIGPHNDRKTLTRVGIEATTFGFDHRWSTDWATRSDRGRSWDLKMSSSNISATRPTFAKSVTLPWTSSSLTKVYVILFLKTLFFKLIWGRPFRKISTSSRSIIGGLKEVKWGESWTRLTKYLTSIYFTFLKKKCTFETTFTNYNLIYMSFLYRETMRIRMILAAFSDS